MSRALSLLGVLQAALVLCGMVALKVSLKFSPGLEDRTVRWHPLVVFLNDYGLLCLLIPAAWMAFAVWAERANAGPFSKRKGVVSGVLLSVLIALLFFHAALFPFTRKLLWWME